MTAVALTRLSDVEPEQVSWLWPGLIPLGKLVILEGDPGAGKSTLAYAIAATVTTGGEWPDGSWCDHRGDVLVMSAEDGLADTIRPRLDAAGADAGRVHSLDGRRTADGQLAPILLSNSVEIKDAITETGARLLIVDVAMAFLTGDAHKDQDVRRVLGPIARVADETGCTILLIRHLKKDKTADPLYRGGGSIGIAGAARAVLVVMADPDDPEVRVMATVKNNLAPMAPSWAYTIVPATVDGVDTSRVEWIGPDDRRAGELVATNNADNFGDMARHVLQLVESQPETRTADVADALKIDGKAANQYLARLCERGRITKVGRGRYAPLESSLPPRREDREESEDSAGQSATPNPHPLPGEDLKTTPEQADPHNPRFPHTVGDDDSPTCNTHPQQTLTDTGRCPLCIADKHNTADAVGASNDNSSVDDIVEL